MSGNVFKKKVRELIAQLNVSKAEIERIEKEYNNFMPEEIKQQVDELENTIKNIETQLRFLQ